jgi:hypothetical protein
LLSTLVSGDEPEASVAEPSRWTGPHGPASNSRRSRALPRDNRVEAQGRWWLRPAIMSTGRIFYEQAGAACQFLYHAENGKYRRKLLDFIVAYYSNNRKALEPTRAFGMSGAQLGVRIEAFARKVSHGWKPGDK